MAKPVSRKKTQPVIPHVIRFAPESKKRIERAAVKMGLSFNQFVAKHADAAALLALRSSDRDAALLGTVSDKQQSA